MTADERVAAMLEAVPLFRVHPVRFPVPGPEGRSQCTCWKGPKCRAVGKHPHLKKWPDRASRKPEAVKKWLKQFPGCNWAVVMGGEHVGVDIDNEEAWEWLQERARYHGTPIPHTIATRTGRGVHLFYRSPIFDVGNGKGRGHIKIDVRGKGGQLLLAGSLHHSGVHYDWLEGCRPADCDHEPALIPDWMVQEILLAPDLVVSPGKAAATANGDAAAVEKPAKAKRTPKGPTEQDLEHRRRLWENNRVDITKFTVRRGGLTLADWRVQHLLFNPRKENYRLIQATWDRNRGPGGVQPFTDQSPSAYEISLANFAACDKRTPQEIVDLIVLWRTRHFPDKPLPHRARLEPTLLKAYLLAEKRGHIRMKRGRKEGSSLGKPSETLKTHIPQVIECGRRVSPVGEVYSVAVAMGEVYSVDNSLGLGVDEFYSMEKGVGWMYPARGVYGVGWAVAVTGAARFRGG